ncbi:MAG: ParB/RepB/Spo0J family partition protein, partial [Acidimicrobiales bacterium]
MARRSGLGRGLGALIPSEGAKPSSGMREIALAKIRPNKLQPRTSFDEAALASLVDSIRAVGILQPVLVREVGDDEYELIAGERRWRAARRAGLIAIPALVQIADDEASLEQALVENIHREGLNPLDEAAGYQQLIEDFHLTHDAVAHRVGKSRASVTNALRLFQLPPSVQRYVRDGQLSAGHARALLATPDRALQERLARKSVEEDLSV